MNTDTSVESAPDVLALTCAVCGQRCSRNMYGAACCDGCRHFFRRAIINQKRWICTCGGASTATSRRACRSCRFDGCLHAGMDWTCVQIPGNILSDAFKQFLGARLKCIQGDYDLPSFKIYLGGVVERKGVFGGCEVVENKVRVYTTSEFSVEEGFLERFGSLRELLSLKEHIFCYHSTLVQQNGQKRIFAFSHIALIIMNLVLGIELCRLSPVTANLEIADLEHLVSYVWQPLVNLCLYFYSSLQNSPVVICRGHNLLQAMRQNPWYRGDGTVHNLAERIFRNGMEPFNRVRPSKQEFLLLRAILIAHSGAPGLSRRAQDLLQEEAEHYSRALMQLLRATLGDVRGAVRFAEVLHLVECCFHSAARNRELNTYLAMVADQDLLLAHIPRALLPMFLHGSVA